MSFGDLPFAGGHVGITHKMIQKCIRNTSKHIPDMSLEGEGPLTRQNRAQLGGERSP
jgi:hypothetical protein